jgi:hypothetical protein
MSNSYTDRYHWQPCGDFTLKYVPRNMSVSANEIKSSSFVLLAHGSSDVEIDPDS